MMSRANSHTQKRRRKRRYVLFDDAVEAAAKRNLVDRWEGDDSILIHSPLREDKNASVLLSRGDNDQLIAVDRAPVEPNEVFYPKLLAALGLIAARRSPGERTTPIGPGDLYADRDIPGWVAVKYGVRSIQAIYDYNEADGTPLYQVVRFLRADSEKVIIPRRPVPLPGELLYHYALKPIRLPDGRELPAVDTTVPYRLPSLLAAPLDRPVYIVEGEKCADALHELGLIASTTSGGAGNARKSLPRLRQVLDGRTVVVLGDNDESGKAYVDTIARGIVHVAASVTAIYGLPGLTEKGDDVVEWLGQGHTADDLARLVDASPALSPADCPQQVTESTTDDIARKYRLTEAGMADRMVEQYPHHYRFDALRKLWLRWENTHWAVDHAESAALVALDIVRRVGAVEAAEIADVEEAETVRRRALTFERNVSMNAIAAIFRRYMAVVPSQLDADPLLLNLLNGTLWMGESIELKDHDPADLLTKVAPVEWRGLDEACPLFLAVIARALPDQELQRFVQQFFGLSLTGRIDEQVLPFWYGDGANGKSLILDTIGAMLGGYAGFAAPGLLEVTKGEPHPTEIIDLLGKRLVVASETEAGRRLRTQRVKSLTGDSRLKGRGMRQDFVEFDRTHKLILVGNNKPRIDEDTEGIWRRLRLVPFDVVIPAAERDPRLLAKLEPEWPGILAWCVRGYLDWLEHGLVTPEAIAKATEEYRDEENPVAIFVKECCVLGDFTAASPESQRFAIRAADLYPRYERWCQSSGRRAEGNRNFASQLRKAFPTLDKGTARFSGRQCECWKGIRLIETPTQF